MVSLLTHICVTRPQWVNTDANCNVQLSDRNWNAYWHICSPGLNELKNVLSKIIKDNRLLVNRSYKLVALNTAHSCSCLVRASLLDFVRVSFRFFLLSSRKFTYLWLYWELPNSLTNSTICINAKTSTYYFIRPIPGPANTRYKHVIITSKRRFDAIITCLLRCVFAG